MTIGAAIDLAAMGLLLAAAGTDIAARRIPNRIVLALVLVGMARLSLDLAATPDWASGAFSAGGDIAAALALFAGGAVLFHMRAIGGGDVKLLAAAGLWLGAPAVPALLLGMAVAGGALALGMLARRAATPGGARRDMPSVPYGVAIAAGALSALLSG